MDWNKDTREIYVYDAIGPDYDGFVSAAAFTRALRAMGPGGVTLRINSPGGNIFECWAIIEQLRRHQGQISTHVDGLAASAASALLCLGDTRTGSRESMTMIHAPWAVFVGDCDEARHQAVILETMRDRLVTFYSERLRVSESTVRAWMTAGPNRETWFDSDSAIKHGIIHRISDHAGQSAAASVHAPLREAAAKRNRESKARFAAQQAKWRIEKAAWERSQRRDVKNAVTTAVQRSPHPLRTAAALKAIKQRNETRRILQGF